MHSFHLLIIATRNRLFSLWNVAGTRPGLRVSSQHELLCVISEKSDEEFLPQSVSSFASANPIRPIYFNSSTLKSAMSLVNNYHASRALISSFFTERVSSSSIWRMGFDSLIATLVLYYYLESLKLSPVVFFCRRAGEELAAGSESKVPRTSDSLNESDWHDKKNYRQSSCDAMKGKKSQSNYRSGVLPSITRQ